MSALKIVEPSPTRPLSPVRAELRDSIAALAAAIAKAEEARRPYDRLAGLVSAFAAAERQLAALRAQDDARLRQWLAADNEGPRPEPSAETAAAEKRVGELAAEKRVAETMMAEILPAVQVTQGQVEPASQRRADLICRAAIEAVGETIEAEFSPALRELLRIEARLRSVQQAVSDWAHRARPVAGAAAAAGLIVERIEQAKRQATALRDDGIGRKLLDALARDPATRL